MSCIKKAFLLSVFLLSAWSVCAEITVSNAGVPGNSSKEALARLARDVLSEKPYAVIILLGTNDALNPAKMVSPEEFEKNLIAISRKLKQNGVEKIIFITPFPAVESILRKRSPRINIAVPLPETLEEYMRKYGKAVYSAAKKSDAVVIDSFEFFAANGGAKDGKDSLFRTYANSKAHDGVHLNGAGYAKFAAFAASKVRDMLPENCHVVCLGDSITFGVHVKGAGSVEGETYPAQLWRLLNPELAAGNSKPSVKKRMALNRNLIPNGNMEKLDENRFPSDWKFNRKDKDSAAVIDEDGHGRAVRISRNSKTPALIRTELFRITPGRYRWSLLMRGKGMASVSFSFYHPVKHQLVKSGKLAQKWQTFSGEITIPAKTTQAALTLRIYGNADIKEAVLVKIEDASPSLTGDIREFQAYTEINSSGIRIAFSSPATGAAVTGIRNGSGREFINFKPDRGIWSIRLKRKDTDSKDIPPVTAIACDPEMDDSADSIGKDGENSNDLIIDSSAAQALGAKCVVENSDGKLFFRWKNIRVGNEKNALDVSICVSPTANGGMNFSGSVVNRSKKYTVFYFNYPQISGLGKINGNAEDDFLATPHYLGRLIKNPASGKLLNGSRLFRSNNSGHSMHFDAFYSKSGDGLFFGVWDGEQNCKRWDLTSSAVNGFSWSCVNLPDNMKSPAPQKWAIPYPIELRSFSGDWYDAAQIYRSWAIRQKWCGKGTLLQRRDKDIPGWFLDMTLWLHVSVDNLLYGQKEDCEKYFSDFKDHRIGIWLTHWGLDNRRYDFPNPDRFPLTAKDKKVLDMLQKSSYPVSGYIQLTAWSRSMPSFKANPGAEKNLLRNFYGQILSWGGSGFRKESMLAYPGELWRKVLNSFTDRMVRSGFSVAYLDSGNHGGAHLNFTPHCTKTSGGGSDYVENNRRLMTQIRASGRKINPDFCITTESFWEGNLHCLDAVLCVNSPSAYLEGSRVTAIPLAPAVYNDYALLFATHYGRGDLTGQARGLIAKTAQALLWGIMPGWELPHAMYRFSDPERVRRSSKQRMEAFDAGRKFFVYGKMLRQPEIIGDNPLLTIPWGIGWQDRVYTVKSPAVLASAFRAPDGTFAIMLYNLDEKPHRIHLKLDDREYQAAKKHFTAIYPAELSFECDKNILVLTVPAQCPVIIEGRGE